MSQKCARCASPIAEGSVSCGRCGARIPAPTTPDANPRWGGLEIERNSVPQQPAPTAPRPGAVSMARPRPSAPGAQTSTAGPRPGADQARSPEPPPRRPTAPRAPVAIRSVATAAPAPEPPENANQHDVLNTGLIALGGTFSGSQAGAERSLELASMPPPKGQLETDVSITLSGEAAEPLSPSAASKRQELANYGPVPAKLLQTVPYFFRVMLRKRVLDAEVAALSLHRKHLDAQAEEALCAFAEALYALRSDARLKPLEQQLRVVADSQRQVGAREEAEQKADAARKRELDELARDAENIEAKAAPLRTRESELQTQADGLKARISGKEQVVRKADAEIQTLKSSTDAGAIDRIAALTAERQVRMGEIQSLNVQLLPLQEDLSALRRELAKHMSMVSALHEEARVLNAAAGREQERSRVSLGGARSAYRQVLRSLAEAGLRGKLSELAPAKARTATEATARAAAKRETEELYRGAALSYDADRYKQGMLILVGGTGFVFLLFACLIIF